MQCGIKARLFLLRPSSAPWINNCCVTKTHSVFYDLFNIIAAHQEMQYIYLFSYLFSNLADAFIQSDLQMRIYTNIYHMIKK